MLIIKRGEGLCPGVMDAAMAVMVVTAVTALDAVIMAALLSY